MKRLVMGFVMDDRKVEEKWKFVPEPAFCYLYCEVKMTPYIAFFMNLNSGSKNSSLYQI